jgi:Family of unknown function (DUF5906)/Domain of unknown function (DUF6371)
MKLTAKELAEQLGRGKQVKLNETSYNTVCPAHDDNGPSLTVSESRDGRILVKCHAGCPQSSVIEALEQRGLWQKKSKTWKVLNKGNESNAPTNPRHSKFGVPGAKWEYRNIKGELVGFVFRFEHEGRKDIVPMVYCVAEEDGEHQWRWKSFNKPRPLYNEHLLRDDRTSPVLLVEGEKTADAAAKLFTDYIVVTWAGGSSAVKHANFEVLKGRDVIIWPDADEPGLKAATLIGEILLTAGAKSLKLVYPPKDLPKGWDLADPVPEGVELDRRASVITAPEFQPSGDSKIDEMNRQFALTILGDKATIIWDRWDPLRKRNMPNYIAIAALRALYANEFVQVGRKEQPIVEYWMTHPSRKTYDGVVFEPGANPERYYNLWRGFTVEPDPTGEWDLFEEHMRLNVAQGDEDLYHWIMAWFAQMFQDPRHKPGTSIAFRGLQGCGKTVVGQHMGALIRDNYVLVDDPRYVLGNFNSHMGHALLLQADEGFFAGDPRHIGRLKGLVTSDTNRIEPKGKDSFEINNYLRLLVSSNEKWIVPAAFEERRFAVIDVGDGRLQDKPFFKAMALQLKSGGYEGLLHHLLTMDISGIDVGVIPKTAALTEQKQHSLDMVARFWFERLRDGEIMPGVYDWPTHVCIEDLYQALIKRAMMWGITRRVSDNQFGRELKDMMPGGTIERSRKSVTRYDHSGHKDTVRAWCYILPPLELCRTAFEEMMGTKIDWDRYDRGEISDNEDDIPF